MPLWNREVPHLPQITVIYLPRLAAFVRDPTISGFSSPPKVQPFAQWTLSLSPLLATSCYLLNNPPRSKSSHVVHFSVKAGDVITWEFATLKRDIGFGEYIILYYMVTFYYTFYYISC